MSSTERAAPAASSAVQAYSPALDFTRLALGVDNIRYDVFLSPGWREQASQFLFEQILHYAQRHLSALYPSDPRSRSACANEFKRRLAAVLNEALTQAKQQNNIEIDLLARLALIKWLLGEMQYQFLKLEDACKERAAKRSGLRVKDTMSDFVTHSKIADYKSNRRYILRGVGESLFQILEELEERNLRPGRQALFGSDFSPHYRVVRNRLVFLENPNDGVVHLENYVMLGHFVRDPDHEERVSDILVQLFREQGGAPPESDELARLEQLQEKRADELQEINRRLREAEEEPEGHAQPELFRGLPFRWLGGRRSKEAAEVSPDRPKQAVAAQAAQRERLAREVEELEQRVAFLRQAHETRTGELLSNPANAERLFGALTPTGEPQPRNLTQEALLRKLYMRLEQAGMLKCILASYHIRPLYKEFCPPLNPQQIKYAVADRQAWAELENLLDQFPAQYFPEEKLEEVARRVRRIKRQDAEAILVRFARDLMRLRRDLLHRQRLNSLMEKIHVIEDDKTRQVSWLNRSLYGFLLPEEQEAGEEHVLTHVVLKADVRDSTRITEELLSRGLNPATHFNFNFYEPVHKLITRYSASKIFIEGDALILGIYETESNRAHQRPVAKACLLAKAIVEVCQANNQRARSNNLPALELGLGIAFQSSPPHYWTDGESRILISAALNNSDRLASCTKMARKLIADKSGGFHVFYLQAYPVHGSMEEQEEFLLRFNVMGVALNEEGFQKLRGEISLSPVRTSANLLGEKEEVTLHSGTVPIGEGFEKLIIREARVPRIRLPAGRVEEWTPRIYYEVCVDPLLYRQFPGSPA